MRDFYPFLAIFVVMVIGVAVVIAGDYVKVTCEFCTGAKLQKVGIFIIFSPIYYAMYEIFKVEGD